MFNSPCGYTLCAFTFKPSSHYIQHSKINTSWWHSCNIKHYWSWYTYSMCVFCNNKNILYVATMFPQCKFYMWLAIFSVSYQICCYKPTCMWYTNIMLLYIKIYNRSKFTHCCGPKGIYNDVYSVLCMPFNSMANLEVYTKLVDCIYKYVLFTARLLW